MPDISQMTVPDYGIPFEAFIEYIIKVESGGNPYAINKKSGARGLTQLTRIAWEDLQDNFPEKYKSIPFEIGTFNPEISRQAGLDYLVLIDRYLDHYGLPKTMENYLAAYNWGIGNLYKKGLENMPEETRTYIHKIKSLLNIE